jgi:polar amino acid transport system substrate-binding protein
MKQNVVLRFLCYGALALTGLRIIVGSPIYAEETIPPQQATNEKTRQANTSQPSQLLFCHENGHAYPWVMHSNGESSGLDIELLNLVAKELNIDIQYLSLPWKRCLNHLETYKVDGAFAASYKQERLNMGRYPMTAKGHLDANRRIHTSGYSLYVPYQSKLGWNGDTFINLDGAISIQNGFSIGDKLKRLDVRVVEFHGPMANLLKVKEKRVAGSALQSDRADHILAQNPELAAAVKKYPIPLSSKPYYLMLSFYLVREHPDFAEQLWNTLEIMRESPEMKAIEERFYQTPPN